LTEETLNPLNAEARIAAFLRFGSKLGLERMQRLMELLGHPESELRVLHVAGTNGKGSVSRYLYESLLALGYTAGFFTSPFVTDFRERIQLNGEMISEAALEALTDKVLVAAETVRQNLDESLTEFEIITAIGLCCFAKENLDFVVLEVGLGGRGDSTNIIEAPLVSVITNITYDHMDRLGDTLPEIAAEKAGIIKAGCPVITGAAGEAAKVIARRAYEKHASLLDVTRIPVRVTERSLRGSRFSCVIGGRRYDGIETSMPGAHQVDNAVTALCVLENLRSRGLVSLDAECLRAGMRRAQMPARFQVFAGDPPQPAASLSPAEPLDSPLLILDGAHNEAGARALADTLKDLCAEKRTLFVTAILRDKEVEKILRFFAEVAAGFVATEVSGDRGLSAAELAFLIERAGGKVEAVCPPDIKGDVPIVSGEAMALEALRRAYEIERTGCYDMIVCAGSLYLMGDLLRETGALVQGAGGEG